MPRVSSSGVLGLEPNHSQMEYEEGVRSVRVLKSTLNLGLGAGHCWGLSRVFPIAHLKPGVSATAAQEQLHALHAMQQVELGFRPEHVMVMDLSLPPNRYPTWEQRNQFARELLQHAETLPGVEAATVGNGGLPFDTDQLNYVIEGHDDSQKRVAAGYLRTMRIPLKRERIVSSRR